MKQNLDYIPVISGVYLASKPELGVHSKKWQLERPKLKNEAPSCASENVIFLVH